jgi:hypothetical protein
MSDKELNSTFSDFSSRSLVANPRIRSCPKSLGVPAVIINHHHHHHQYYGRCGREKRRRILFQPVASEVR